MPERPRYRNPDMCSWYLGFTERTTNTGLFHRSVGMEESPLGGKGNAPGIAFTERDLIKLRFFTFSIGFDPIQE